MKKLIQSIKKIIRNVQDDIRMFFYKIEFKKYKKWCRKNKQREYIIFCAPLHGNIGDHAIIYAEKELLKDINVKFFEITNNDASRIFGYIKNNVDENAIILITGGGFMGSQWTWEEDLIRKIVESYKNNKIIVLPQTIYYKDDENGKDELKKSQEIYNSHKNLYICAREKKTYDGIKDIFPNVKKMFLPDMVLYLETYKNNIERDEILVCLRKDPEKKLTHEDEEKISNILKKYSTKIRYTDTVIEKRIYKAKREKVLKSKLNEFTKAKLVITDRLHGMIFAAITQTPCIVFENYNHKVKGVYEWIKNLDYISLIAETDNLENEINKIIDKKCEYKELKKDYYKELIEELKK